MAKDVGLPEIGTCLGGKYRIERLLGEGVMGVVYEAVNLRLNQHVAIKVPRAVVLAEPVLVDRFAREAMAAARLRHRNSARVIDVDRTEEGVPFMVMELLQGHDLEAEICERGALPADEAVGYVLQACAAMTEAHARGIVHRDLKPSNMFLALEPDGSVCLKVLDFGISKFQSDKVRITQTQVQIGTPLYMSPEQVRSSKTIDQRTDVWSLGVILYELLAGVPPFVGSATSVGAAIVMDAPPPISRRRTDLPEGLEEVVFRALSKNADERFASTRELGEALAPYSTRVMLSELPRSSPNSSGLVSAMARARATNGFGTGTNGALGTRPSAYASAHGNAPGSVHGSAHGSAVFAQPVPDGSGGKRNRWVALAAVLLLVPAVAVVVVRATASGSSLRPAPVETGAREPLPGAAGPAQPTAAPTPAQLAASPASATGTPAAPSASEAARRHTPAGFRPVPTDALKSRTRSDASTSTEAPTSAPTRAWDNDSPLPPP